MKQEDMNVKLCDMGNACYIDNHYSDIIQTREYRSPEVILGGDYDQSADIWSLACMLFELVTGDYLFDPKKGKTYRKNDDHLALITELIGPCHDSAFLERHPKVWKFYSKKKMKLKNISKLHQWPLYNVLLEKYRLKDVEARSLSSFLNEMLKWKPKDRSSARDLLDHPWLKESDEYTVWMSKDHLKEFKLVNFKDFPNYREQLKTEEEKAAKQAEKEKLKAAKKQMKADLKGENSSSSGGSSSSSSSSEDMRDKENKESKEEAENVALVAEAINADLEEKVQAQ